MDPAVIVMPDVKRDSVRMVLQLLRESVGQPGEAPHRHPHGEILALDERGVDGHRVGVSFDDGLADSINPDSVPVIPLDELREINFITERILDGREIHRQPI